MSGMSGGEGKVLRSWRDSGGTNTCLVRMGDVADLMEGLCFDVYVFMHVCMNGWRKGR